MGRRWLPLNALRAFEAVGRHLSFTAAANSLLVSQSAVSRHVIALEQLLGVQLFERRPHQLTLTEAGRMLLPVVSKGFDRLEATLKDIVKDEASLKRVLTVQMPPSFAHHLAVPILRDFRRECPDVVLDVESPYHVGPPQRDTDLAVTFAKPQVSDQVADLLWQVSLVPLCHPELAAAHAGAGMRPLLEACELLHVKHEGESRYRSWERFVRQYGLGEIKVDRGLVFETASLAAQYALSGEGVALLDPLLFDEEIATGRLAMPFDARIEDGYGYWLVTDPDDLSDGAIALFRSWLIRRFKTRDRPARSHPAAAPTAEVVRLRPTPRRNRP